MIGPCGGALGGGTSKGCVPNSNTSVKFTRHPSSVVSPLQDSHPVSDPSLRINALSDQFRFKLVQASLLKLNIDSGVPQYTGSLLSPTSTGPTPGRLSRTPVPPARGLFGEP